MTMSRMFRGVLLILALMLCLTGLAGLTGEVQRASAEGEETEIVSGYPYTTVTRVKVNLRAARSVKSELLKRIPEGAEISVLEKNGSWARVEYGSSKGWVRTEYIVLKTIGKIKVTPTPSPVPTLSPEENAGGYNILRKGSTGSHCFPEEEQLSGHRPGRRHPPGVPVQREAPEREGYGREGQYHEPRGRCHHEAEQHGRTGRPAAVHAEEPGLL